MAGLSTLLPAWLRGPLARLARSDASWLGVIGRHSTVSSSGMAVTPDTAQALSPVYACCRVLVDALASIDFACHESLPAGGKRRIDDTDCARALATWTFQDKELALWAMVLGGNGFIRIERNERGGIVNLHGLAPRYMTLELDQDFAVFYRYRDRFAREALYAPGEVVHLKYRSTEDEFLALPPVVAAADAIGNALAVRAFSAAVFRNGAYPRLYLKHPGVLGKDAIDRIKEAWAAFHSGIENVGKSLVLEEGMEVVPLELGSATDAQMIDASKFSVAEVSRLYGVPLSMLAETGTINYSTSAEERRAFVSNTLAPLVARVSDVLTHSLIPADQRHRVRIDADLSHLTVGHGKEQAEWASQLLAAGVFNINEVRMRFGLPDIAGGEQFRVPVNSVTLDNLPLIGVPNATPAPESGAARMLRIIEGGGAHQAATLAPPKFKEALAHD
ncbi:MAG: phage portal protein [Gammaproteobacteria bacterium]